MTEPHTVEVTQQDRDAAVRLVMEMEEVRPSFSVCVEIREGQADHAPYVQAFARYRASLTSPLPATEMAEAVARAQAFARRSQHDCARDADHYWHYCSQETQESELKAARAAIPIVIAAERERAAIAARDALVDYDWPPQDGDAQIDAVMDAIRLAPSASPTPRGVGD